MVRSSGLSCQGFDESGVAGIMPYEGFPVGQLEFGEVKAWRYGASDKGIFAFCGRCGCKPASCFYDGIEILSFFRVRAEAVGDQLP